jgi:outer membrane protein assembly factor BamB
MDLQVPVHRSIWGVHVESLNGVVYIEDPDSNVYALNRETGAVIWKHLYKSVTPSGGPNGLALGYGLLFGATEGSAFALNPSNGKQVWIHKLIGNNKEGIDMAPQLYDGKVLVSTIPGSSSNFYQGGAFGTVFSMDAKTGKTIWSFQTVKGGAKLFGNPKVNSGGGLWYRRRSTATGGSSYPSPIRRRFMEPRSSRTGRVAPVRISTRTRSSPSTARRGSCSGSAR